MPIPKSLLNVAGPAAGPARALLLARECQRTLTALRELPPDQRAAVEKDAEELGMAIVRVTQAARAEVVKNHRPTPVNWELARSQALHPGPEFALAKLVVETLRNTEDHGDTMATPDLAKAVGAIGNDDGIFRTALHIAEEDGYIERTVGRHWRPTGFSSGDLSDAPHIKALEESVVARVEAVGLIDTEELALAVGRDGPNAPEFRAALHRAVSRGLVSWLNWSTYGLPPARLAQFEAVDRTSVHTSDAMPDLHEELHKATIALRAIRQTLESSGHATEPAGPRTPPAADPASRLKRLAELHVAGLVDNEEFDAKRAELIELL